MRETLKREGKIRSREDGIRSRVRETLKREGKIRSRVREILKREGAVYTHL